MYKLSNYNYFIPDEDNVIYLSGSSSIIIQRPTDSLEFRPLIAGIRRYQFGTPWVATQGAPNQYRISTARSQTNLKQILFSQYPQIMFTKLHLSFSDNRQEPPTHRLSGNKHIGSRR